MFQVAVVRYRKPRESLKQAIDLCSGFGRLEPDMKVFLKPNLVVWHEGIDFPKYGVMTTARLIEDCVVLLKEYGIDDITLIEGPVVMQKTTESHVRQAARGMGLETLTKRYGLKIIDVLQGAFVKMQVEDLAFSINEDIMSADFVINMPVLKTHSQARVSLGVKNLKGLLGIQSRKECHNADQQRNLDYYLSRLPDAVSPSLTVIDGIYTLERGPFYNGRARRSDVILASTDLLSADFVGSAALGIEPFEVPYLKLAADRAGRKGDLSDIEILGGLDVKDLLKPHCWEFPQNESGDLPLSFERAGIKGLRYPEGDKTICTYCSLFINYVVMGIFMAKNRDRAFDDIEVLYGKVQKPSPNFKHTLLVGQCQVKENAKNPLINHCVAIRGCPPKLEDFVDAYKEVGIELPDDFLEWMDKSPETVHLRKYKDDPKFDPSFFHIG